jgi:outer membrane protein
MSRRITGYIAVVVGSLSFATVAAARESAQELSRLEAIQLSMRHNPSLQAALLDVEQSQQLVRAEQGRFVPVLQLDGGFTHSEGPRLQRDGGVTISRNDTTSVGSQVSHTFEWGTQLSLRLEGYRSTSTQQLTPGSGQSVRLGPAYGTLGRLTLTQPLLRGAGTDVGEAALRQARLARNATVRARDVAASRLLCDVLAAYWELWYRTQAVQIEQTAFEFAKQQRADAARRIATGALAPVELLSYETRVAELEQSYSTAQAQRRQQAVTLVGLLGTEQFEGDLYASTDLGAEAHTLAISRTDAVAAALAQSPEVAQLEARVAQAADRVKTAGEAERPRLDFEAYAQSEQLAREVGPAADHVGTRPALSAHAGLIFELPLSGTSRSAERRAAELAVEAERARLRETRTQIQSQVHAAFVQAEAARTRLVLSEATVRVARQQVDAQRRRYLAGAAILIEVQQAEDALRKAELSVERARVDLVLAVLEVDQLTGNLLIRHAGEVLRQTGSQVASSAELGYLALPRRAEF